jgi:cystathionine beta-lyase
MQSDGQGGTDPGALALCQDVRMSTSWRTTLLHPTRHAAEGFRSLVTPVHRASTTVFARAESIRDTWNHDEAPYTCGQYGTPTTLELAARVAELEGGRWTLITSGGQTVLTLVYLALLEPGDHVLVPESVSRPAAGLLVLRRHGVEVLPPLEGAAIAARRRGPVA